LIAIGVAVSSFFNNQIAAFFITEGVNLILWFAARPPAGMTGGIADVWGGFNIIDHYVTFFQGVIDVKDIVYYLSLTAFCLFLGTMAVEMRRWR